MDIIVSVVTLWIIREKIIRTILYIAIVTTIAYSVQFLQASYGLLGLGLCMCLFCMFFS